MWSFGPKTPNIVYIEYMYAAPTLEHTSRSSGTMRTDEFLSHVRKATTRIQWLYQITMTRYGCEKLNSL